MFQAIPLAEGVQFGEMDLVIVGQAPVGEQKTLHHLGMVQIQVADSRVGDFELRHPFVNGGGGDAGFVFAPNPV